MKSIFKILLLLIVVVVLGTVYFKMTNTDDPDITGTLYDFKPNIMVEKINIKNTYGEFDFFQEDDIWMVSSDGIYRANQVKVDILIQDLLDFKVTRVLEEGAEEYALENPDVVVSFTTSDGNDHQFSIGGMTSSAAHYYVQNLQTEEIVVTSSSVVAQMTGSLEAYRNKELIAVDKGSVIKFEYYEKDEHVLTVESENSVDWTLTYPFNEKARKIEVNEFLYNMLEWPVAGYPEIGDKDYEAMGLTNPESVIVLTDEFGEVQRFEFGVSDGTYTYARVGGQDDIIKLYTVDTDFETLVPETIMFVLPLKNTYDEVDSIQIQTQDMDVTFDIENDTNITLDGKKIEYTDFSGVFFKYTTISALGRVDKVTGDKVATLHTVKKDGTEITVELFERDETTLFMQIDGDKSYFIDISELEELLYAVNDAIK